MSRIIKLEATISVEDDVEIGEVSMPFDEFLEHTLPELMEHDEEYQLLDSDVDVLFDN
jgi:hypothetical protein